MEVKHAIQCYQSIYEPDLQVSDIEKIIRSTDIFLVPKSFVKIFWFLNKIIRIDNYLIRIIYHFLRCKPIFKLYPKKFWYPKNINNKVKICNYLDFNNKNYQFYLKKILLYNNQKTNGFVFASKLFNDG